MGSNPPPPHEPSLDERRNVKLRLSDLPRPNLSGVSIDTSSLAGPDGRKPSILMSDRDDSDAANAPKPNAHPHFVEDVNNHPHFHKMTDEEADGGPLSGRPRTSSLLHTIAGSSRSAPGASTRTSSGLASPTHLSADSDDAAGSSAASISGKATVKANSDPRIPQSDGKIHILLGVTGSLHVQTLRHMILKLQDIFGDRVAIQIILTRAAENMIGKGELPGDVHIWHDKDEWDTWRSRSDPVVHIELRRWADILVIAPLSANTLGKIAMGLCDNLLTSVVRAWNPQYPILIAPAMVSYAYSNPSTKWHLRLIKEEMKWIEILRPTEKVAGSHGGLALGGMMAWNEIVDKIVNKLGGYPEDDEDDEEDDEAAEDSRRALQVQDSNEFLSDTEDELSPVTSPR